MAAKKRGRGWEDCTAARSPRGRSTWQLTPWRPSAQSERARAGAGKVSLLEEQMSGGGHVRVWEPAWRVSHSAGLNRGPGHRWTVGPGPPRRHCRVTACSEQWDPHGRRARVVSISSAFFADLCVTWWSHQAGGRWGPPWARWRAEQETATFPSPAPLSSFLSCTFSRSDRLTCMSIPGPGRPSENSRNRGPRGGHVPPGSLNQCVQHTRAPLGLTEARPVSAAAVRASTSRLRLEPTCPRAQPSPQGPACPVPQDR